ncbi:MAG: Asp/Glu racemase [Myxococcota bacterium]
METEIPEMLARIAGPLGVRFTFHAARMPMRTVNLAELTAMDGMADACARSLGDAQVDAVAYACLVAVLCQGPSYAAALTGRLRAAAAEAGGEPVVVTSATALIDGIHALGAKRVALIAPYLRPLTDTVVGKLEAAGITVVDALSLEIASNVAVGARDPLALVELVSRLNLHRVDAIVLSACVQMPSLAAIPIVEAMTGLPVLSAATATTRALLDGLGLAASVPDAGALLRRAA